MTARILNPPIKRTMGVFLIGIGLVGLFVGSIYLGGFPVGQSLRALVEGAFGSLDAVLSATLVRAVPLLLTGLAVTIAFKAGVLNIGAEGQLLIGAGAATYVGLAVHLGSWTLLAELIAATVAGAAWAWLPAFLRRRFNALEVISTIMMNFVAIHLTSYLVRGPLQEPSRIYPQSPSLPDIARIPILFPDSRLHWGLVLAVCLISVFAWILNATAVGYRILVTGAGPSAAREAGRIDVRQLTFGVFLVSGALAGLAGGIQVAGVTFALYENISPGYGYTAIAVALLAGLRPIWLLPSAFFFGALDAGSAAMQRDAGVPAGYVSFLQALIVLALLAAPRLFEFTETRSFSRAPVRTANNA